MFVYKLMLEKISFMLFLWDWNYITNFSFSYGEVIFWNIFFSNNSNFRLGDLLLEILCAIFKNFCFEIGGQ